MGVLTISSATPALVLFGRDQAGKPHASWFDAASVELAAKAAGLMSMRTVPVETDELREIAASLPRGRMFSSGRAFTPFVKGKLYERLVELTRDVLGLEPASAANSNGPGDESDGAAVEPRAGVEGDATLIANGESKTDEAAIPAAAPVGASSSAPAKAAEPKAAKLAAADTSQPVPRPSRVEEIGPGSLVLATTGAAEGWYESRVVGVNGSAFTLKWVDFNEASFVRRGNELGLLPRLPA